MDGSSRRDEEGANERFDLVIVGAGLSGIDAAYRVQTLCPGLRFAVLEARDAIGGTWDLFRYPGVRSDSDMTTLGFPFRPWRERQAIAEGAAIRRYIEDTARASGILPRIRFGQRVVRAAWSSDEQAWTLTIESDDGPRTLRCRFLHVGAGYYDYDAGYTPPLPGLTEFAGPVVHPQHWPDGLELRGRRIVVIGSGATAVTLVPALARRGARVTMLQRSPSYVVALPAEDRWANWARTRLPAAIADRLVRWKNVALGVLTYRFARRWPERTRRMMLRGAARALGSEAAVEPHFAPSYRPWDQRVCIAPGGDLFSEIRTRRVRIVTDKIARILPHGVHLASGATLDADMLVTATGLQLKLLGGIEIVVDGAVRAMAEAILYKGMMLSDVPNLAFAFGYTNASWTLKCDLVARYLCRLLNHMRAHGHGVAVPRFGAEPPARRPMVDFTSGYIRRAEAMLPGQGDRPPWRLHQNYWRDWWMLQRGRIEDGTMHFAPAHEPWGAPARAG